MERFGVGWHFLMTVMVILAVILLGVLNAEIGIVIHTQQNEHCQITNMTTSGSGNGDYDIKCVAN